MRQLRARRIIARRRWNRISSSKRTFMPLAKTNMYERHQSALCMALLDNGTAPAAGGRQAGVVRAISVSTHGSSVMAVKSSESVAASVSSISVSWHGSRR